MPDARQSRIYNWLTVDDTTRDRPPRDRRDRDWRVQIAVFDDAIALPDSATGACVDNGGLDRRQSVFRAARFARCAEPSKNAGHVEERKGQG